MNKRINELAIQAGGIWQGAMLNKPMVIVSTQTRSLSVVATWM